MTVEELDQTLDALARTIEVDDPAAAHTSPSAWTTIDLLDRPPLRAKLFILPRGHEIPLHDHPGMHARMRVINGALRLRAYDWNDPQARPGLARLRFDRTLEAGETAQLAPGWANIHELVAVRDCAFIDVISPFYSVEEGRPCTYYRRGAAIDDQLVELLPW
jgi:hypothetical protein